MNELLSLLSALLENGKIKIEVTISLIDQKPQISTGGRVEIECPYCGWTGQYADTRAANAARRGHLAQCPHYHEAKAADLPDWLRNSQPLDSE